MLTFWWASAGWRSAFLNGLGLTSTTVQSGGSNTGRCYASEICSFIFGKDVYYFFFPNTKVEVDLPVSTRNLNSSGSRLVSCNKTEETSVNNLIIPCTIHNSSEEITRTHPLIRLKSITQ